MALTEGRTIRIVHTKNMEERLRRARQILGIIEERFSTLETDFRAMCRVSLDAVKLAAYLAEVFPDPEDPENERARRKARENRFWAEYFFDGGKGSKLAGVRGTLWAAYNGVTELVDHRRTQQPAERRLDSVWFGGGYLTKARAFKIAKRKLAVWLT